MSEPIISIRDVSVRFGAVQALRHISLDIEAGEIFALLGPSGCGKSTLLRTLSGFEHPSSGQLLLDGKDLTRLPPNRRPINMVFQSYAVFPHMSVAENVAYGLKMEGIAKDEIDRRVTGALAQVHLDGLAARRPEQLSGGQRQRVALARALIKQPRVLLLDEPLSALDAKLRDAMRLELVRLQESVGITFVMVTHDQSEAMAMADRIAVLESGCLRQVATPAMLYRRPADAFVADFIGTIHSFAITAVEPAADGSDCWLISTDELGTLTVPAEQLPPVDPTSLHQAAVRPEHIRVSHSEPRGDVVAIEGTHGDVAFQGQYSIHEIRLAGRSGLTAITAPDPDGAGSTAERAGTPLWASWSLDDMLFLPEQAVAGSKTAVVAHQSAAPVTAAAD